MSMVGRSGGEFAAHVRALPRGLQALTTLSAESWAAFTLLFSPRARRLVGRHREDDELGMELAALTWLLVAAGFAGQLRGRRPLP